MSRCLRQGSDLRGVAEASAGVFLALAIISFLIASALYGDAYYDGTGEFARR